MVITSQGVFFRVKHAIFKRIALMGTAVFQSLYLFLPPVNHQDFEAFMAINTALLPLQSGIASNFMPSHGIPHGEQMCSIVAFPIHQQQAQGSAQLILNVY
jgi:hypothetical protein